MCSVNPTTWEIVRRGLANANIIVVLLSGDDEARLKKAMLKDTDGLGERELTVQPRQNVLLEMGMALGMAPGRTVLVRSEPLREISDISGINWVTMGDSAPARSDFADELRKALRHAGVSDPLADVPEMWDSESLGSFSIN